MKLKTFLGLDTPEQYERFWDNCIFLEHYIDVGVKYHLYYLYDFYVELRSDMNGKLNLELHTFTEGSRLDKYRQGELDYIAKQFNTNPPEN